MFKKACVNALLRAYSISTVPSGSPLFMRLPRPIFASNSQNILKISVFQPFFGLICTHSLIALIITKVSFIFYMFKLYTT